MVTLSEEQGRVLMWLLSQLSIGEMMAWNLKTEEIVTLYKLYCSLKAEGK